MKIFKIMVATTLMSLPFSTFAKEVSVTVKGMVCGFCAQGIEKKLKARPEVSAVDVSLESKIVKISTKENKDISDETINGILKEAGYNVEKIQRGDKL